MKADRPFCLGIFPPCGIAAVQKTSHTFGMGKFILSIFLFVGYFSSFAQDNYQPRNTQAPGEEPPTPQEAADLITVPEGFQVRLFAGDPDVRQPVAMALDDRGRLFVGESYSYKEWEKKGEDRILIFEDTDNDGRHDSRKVFVSGIDHLSGMTVGWGGVWVCSSPNLLFYPDKNRDDIPDGEPVVVLDGWTTKAKHNFFNGLTWGIDGWLYGRHGITSPSKVGKPGAPAGERIEFDCAIWRYHPGTEKFEVVCRGTTNPWGMDWNEKGDLFFTNNVNGHLWHAIPGAYYPRMGNRADPFTKFVYDRIGMCCDHLHHAGAHTDWTKTRDGKGVHGELGGGHSHSGGMIYQGGKWPAKYHDKMFMCNTHGRRVNVDRLEPKGSTYVGKHEPDFLHANNSWFRGVQLIYGPDGDVYLSDWVDNGECHDNDGVHRTSGRIYKIIYGEPSPPMQENLWEMSNEELLALQEHENEWYARKSRWILLERIKSGEFPLRRWIDGEKIFDQNFSVDDFNRTFRKLFAHSSQSALSQYGGIVETRKAASALREQDGEEVWLSAERILRTSSNDTTINLLTYYGIKDHAAAHPAECQNLLQIAAEKRPLFTKNLSQNLAENGVFAPLISTLQETTNDQQAASILAGFAPGIQGRKDLEEPNGWSEVFIKFFDNPDMRADVLAIHQIFDEDGSRNKLRELLTGDPTRNEPQLALDLLASRPASGLTDSILPLLENPDLSNKVIPVLARMGKPDIGKAIVDRYSQFPPATQALAVTSLSSNRKLAGVLLDAISAKQIPRHAVTAYHAREIQTYKDDALNQQLAKSWGRLGSSSSDKRAEIKKWQDQLLPDVLAKADLKNGHAKFQQLCMACHNLNGEGGNIGPELTGANRDDLYYLLENIIDPSATLPADYRMTVVTQKDDSVISGNVESENEYTITLRTLADSQVIQKDSILKREILPQSLMPEGLLQTLNPDDVRDLIAFLQE